MEDSIEKLIQHHRIAKLEVSELLKELSNMDSTKMTSKDKNTLERSIIRFQEEYSWRGVFLNDLENLL